MLTLTNAAKETKLVLIIGASIIGIILALLILIRVGGAIKNIISPPPPPEPTATFGKLPPIAFKKNATSKELIYSLNTVSGALPEFKNIEKVYAMSIPKADILALEKAQAKVEKLDFAGSPSAISDRIYQWTILSPFQKTLSLDILTGDIKFISSYIDNELVIAANNLPEGKEAKAVSKGFLETLEAFPSDIDEDKSKISLFTIKNYVLLPSTSLSNAHLVRVDYFQKNKNDLPIYYPEGHTSPINVTLAGGEDASQVVDANYFYQRPSDKSETYPLKTAEEAFQELKDQKAYIASYFSQSDEVTINKVFLAYYIGEEKQAYLMPIVVFEGSDGFIAYVSAVKDEWINK